MGRGKVYTFRELIRVLRDHDARFEVLVSRGKGSERMLFHPDVNGRSESYPLKCHGEGDEIRRGHIAAIERRFDLPKDLL
jgi:hypothetical protein